MWNTTEQTLSPFCSEGALLGSIGKRQFRMENEPMKI